MEVLYHLSINNIEAWCDISVSALIAEEIQNCNDLCFYCTVANLYDEICIIA